MTFQDKRLFKPNWNTDDLEHDNPKQAADDRLMKAIYAALEQNYPGHPWAVGVQHKHGIGVVFLQGFAQWGYRFKLSSIAADPGLRLIIKGAGEMLERYRMKRSGFDLGDWRAALRKFDARLFRNKKPPE